MDEIVKRISERTGLDPSVARKAVIIVLKFLMKEGPQKEVEALVDALPGAREAVAASPGGGSSGVMGVVGELGAAGVGMAAAPGFGRAFGQVAREKAGAPTVDAIVRSIPGLAQFV